MAEIQPSTYRASDYECLFWRIICGWRTITSGSSSFVSRTTQSAAEAEDIPLESRTRIGHRSHCRRPVKHPWWAGPSMTVVTTLHNSFLESVVLGSFYESGVRCRFLREQRNPGID